MQTAQHFFILPTAYQSIGLSMEISFEKEILYGLRFASVYLDDTNLVQDEQQNILEKKDEFQNNKLFLQNKKGEQHNEEIPSFARAVFLELAEYFLGVRTQFTIPMHAKGTDFQRSVWKELLHIPYGTTCSYKDIAMGIGNPKACRAVGLANNRNPISILIPCHRVIGANGTLMGYAGQVPVKAALLTLEKQVAQNSKIESEDII